MTAGAVKTRPNFEAPFDLQNMFLLFQLIPNLISQFENMCLLEDL